jgi:glycosyltransferase involved in cell wall biosynthesis
MGGYLLYTGRLRPRKNLSRLIEAYRQVRDQVAAPPLVLSGGLTAHAGELQAQAGRLGLAEHVIFAGYVPDDLLPALYRGATAFVYPSLYEGFALPVLEAMASGVPVVTSSTSATAEVAGEAALLVDPESTAEIASGLVRLLSDQALREDLARRGLARSSRFTWERTARETTGVYRGILRQ